MMLLSLLSILALGGDVTVNAPAEAAPIAEPDGVLRQYDLRAHTLPVDYNAPSSTLLPGSVVFEEEPDELELQWALYADVIVDLISSACGDEFEFEGRMLWYDENRLVVKAPLRVHEKVSRILSLVGEAVQSRTELRVDLITLSKEAAAEAGVGLVDASEVERIYSLGGQRTQRQSYQLSLSPGRAATIDFSQRHRFLAGYDVEVAQGSFAYDPSVRTMITGTRLQVRGAPTPGGLELALIYQHGTPLDKTKVDLGQQGLVGSEGGHDFLRADRMAQRFGVAGRGLACNTALPTGKALVLHSTLSLSEADSTQLLIIRQVGAPLRATYGDGEGGADSELYLINHEALAPLRVRFGGELIRHRLGFPSADQMHWEYGTMLEAGTEWQAGEMAWEVLTTSCPDMEFSDGEWWMTARRDADLVEELKESGARTQQVADVVRSLITESEVVQVGIALQRNGQGDSRGASCGLAVSVGQTSAVVLGVEATSVGDFDVEIAQNSAVLDPITWVTFDGLAVMVTPVRNSGGELSLHVRGFAHLLNSRGSFDPDSPMHGELNQPLFDQLLIDEILPVTDRNKGRFRLGDISPTNDSDSLTLHVQVR